MNHRNVDYQHISVSPIAGALGAEIGCVDLSKPLDPDVLSEIRSAYLENLVIFFRDQDITPDQQKSFARHFGELHINDFIPKLAGHDEIQIIAKEPHQTKNAGGTWHSDVTYKRKPALGSMLYAKELPPFGGDTMFANMYLAYETLSDGMKSLLQELRAEHSAAENFARRAEEAKKNDGPGLTGFQYSEAAEQLATHPVIRTHPESGRHALFVNSVFTKKFEGMTEEESAPILSFLFDHISRPEFSCRFRWSKGAIAFWDNRCAQHLALNDYHGHRRYMNRVTVLGDEPFMDLSLKSEAA